MEMNHNEPVYLGFIDENEAIDPYFDFPDRVSGKIGGKPVFIYHFQIDLILQRFGWTPLLHQKWRR
jgi:hypothetical protein